MKALVVTAFAVVLLAGCGNAPATQSANTSSPAPSSVACPQIEGQQLPPECIPYDPQALMDSNEMYKERYPVSPESFAAFEAEREGITTAIEALQESGKLEADAVAAILADAGVGQDRDTAHAYSNPEGDITFGGAGPLGGCVEGTVTDSELEMNVLGPIMDGGCTAAIGH